MHLHKMKANLFFRSCFGSLSESEQRPHRFSERDGGLILHLSEKVFEHFAEVARLEAAFAHRFEQAARFFFAYRYIIETAFFKYFGGMAE